MTRFGYTLAILASTVLASACTDEVPTETNTPPPGSTSGDETTTFDHDNDYISPWELLDRLTKEGPPRYTSHVHSCSKVRYATLGNVLRDIGVNVDSTTQLSAGDLYRNGFNALGGPNYATEFLGTYIYRMTIPLDHVGYGAALSVILLVLALIMALVLQLGGGREGKAGR